MKLLIDIDEEDYNAIRDNIKAYSLADMLFGAVQCGTILPKGHGDLIDRDKLKIVNLGIGDYDVWGVEDYEINDAPTVIPADKK